ncbi:DNA-binding protein [Burkholderia vietnamiensis]|uniref:DNA-binding protein n=2 Tax=Burkholderiaceae TaxID=119060 RepID=A0AAW7SW24_BURVI|nr:DNA-binding protein [Burkholderia vietnamiensis]MDN7795191.1 DNA-binding protein [Burkholderia vietnamiensis]
MIQDNFHYRCYADPTAPANACLRPPGLGEEVLRRSRKTSQEAADFIDYYFGGGALTLVAARWTYTGKLHENQGDPFFRYGVTPTANKLYSLVRKGSMSTPADVLNRFWQDLRERTRVKIDHPDLPDAVKQVAAEAVLTIWHSASEASAAELAALRAETRHQAHEAEVARDRAAAEAEAARQAASSTQVQLEAVRAQLAESGDALAAERQAHAATDARLQEALRRAERAEAEVDVTRRLVDGLKKTPPARGAARAKG